MKKRLAVLLLALVLILSACGRAGKHVAQAYPETVIIREPTEDNPLQFDFYEALNNIYICEKKVSFPETVADLGEGFSLEGIPINNEDGTVADGLLYYGVDVGGVILEGTVDNYGDNSKITYIMLSTLDENSEQQGIYKFRMGDTVSKEDIVAYFGLPTSEGSYSLVYEFEDSQKRLSFLLDALLDEPTLLWVAITMF
jgi:hypothetical protein